MRFNVGLGFRIAVFGLFAVVTTCMSASEMDFRAAEVVYGAGDDPRAMLMSDVNGDGLPDLITVDSTGNRIGIRLASTATVFLARIDYPTMSQPRAVAVGDITEDGKPDLVVANRGANTVSIFPGLGNGQFGTRMDLITGTQPTGVALADLDLDGHLDVVVVNASASTLCLVRGLGGGTFAPKVDTATGSTPTAVVAIDLNLDDKPDLAVAAGGANTVNVFLGNGDFTLAPKVDYAVGAVPSALVIGDPNHDGIPDLLTVNRSGNSVSVLLNQSNPLGNFAAAVAYAVGPNPEALVLGDVDGDGERDIATINQGAATFSVLISVGDGTFQPKSDFATGSSPRALVVMDCDGNRTNDLLVACAGTDGVNVHINQRPTFATPRTEYHFSEVRGPGSGRPQYSIATADFDGDGKIDLAMANDAPGTLEVKYGFGDGTFSDTDTHWGNFNLWSLAIGDLNNDGRPDIIAADGTALMVFLNRGPRKFSAPRLFYDTGWTSKNSISLSDVNLDGKLDVLISDRLGGFAVWFGQGDGTIVRQSPPLGSTDTFFALAGDMTGDGKPDLVSVNFLAPDTVRVQPGVGDGTFLTGSSHVVSSTPFVVQLGDLNGDGKLDAVVVSQYGSGVEVLLGDGAGGLAAKVSYPCDGPGSVVIADVNGDGKLDVLTANGERASICALLGNGDGTLQVKREFSAGLKTASLAVADANGDGKPDVIVTGDTPRTVNVLLGVGDGTFGMTGTYATGSSPSDVALADLNGDGRLDALVANSGGNSVSVRLGQAGGTLGAPTSFTTGTGPRAVCLVDLNGDGKLDLVTANFGSDTISRRLGNGTGGFGAKVDYATAGGPTDVQALDYNGDGKVDLVVAAHVSQSASMLLGNGDGTFAAKSDIIHLNNPFGVMTGDLNGDGKSEVAILGTGFFWYGHATPWGGGNASLDYGNAGAVSGYFRDLNGDGKLDLVYAGFNQVNLVGVGLGNGDGTFAPVDLYPSGGISGGGRGFAINDINRDGIADMIVSDEIHHTVSVVRGRSDGSFESPVMFPISNKPVALAVGTINGDVWPDIAVVSADADALNILYQTRPTASPDVTAPSTVTTLVVTATHETTVDLSWTAPGDDGAAGTSVSYDLRYATSPITSGTWNAASKATGEPVPSAAGTLQTMQVAGLAATTTYYFALKVSDEVPHISGLSNVVTATTTSDLTAPAAVINLTVTGASVSSVTLSWTAPGDDGAVGTATAYEVRFSSAPITAGNWSAATVASGAPTPMVAGSMQTMTVSGLGATTTYYFALKTSDEVPNVSALSNAVSGATVLESDAPAAVTDLAVTGVTAATVSLTWTASGDDGSVGQATTYELRWATAPITVGSWSSATVVAAMPTPGAAGTVQSMTVNGLTTGITHYFAMIVSDEVPNHSGLSNVVSATPVAPGGGGSGGSSGGGGGGCGLGGGLVGLLGVMMLTRVRLRDQRTK